jgi:lipopolysaccharide/colanic/teichoic acid biosynthesis glycosyltransferase
MTKIGTTRDPGQWAQTGYTSCPSQDLAAAPPVSAAVLERPSPSNKGFDLLVAHGRDSSHPPEARGARASEVALATCLLFLAAPVMAIIALALSLQRRGPALYRQTRVGHGGHHFQMLKFRTLPPAAESEDALLTAAVSRGDLPISDAVAVLKNEVATAGSRFTRFLRKTSLDELPQLWNVIIGDMALVGPRPLRQFEVDALEGWQLARHQIRPGITGLWQVVGRSELSWDVRMQLDCLYASRRSLALDLRIMARTPIAVLRREGAL